MSDIKTPGNPVALNGAAPALDVLNPQQRQFVRGYVFGLNGTPPGNGGEMYAHVYAPRSRHSANTGAVRLLNLPYVGDAVNALERERDLEAMAEAGAWRKFAPAARAYLMRVVLGLEKSHARERIDAAKFITAMSDGRPSQAVLTVLDDVRNREPMSTEELTARLRAAFLDDAVGVDAEVT